ncbi:MAG: hypothetical protein DRI61_00920 [Chloroflexi bacterium]|nr:MAG: hypothetical protein DRI61_00920 [Chloroflexota bacterium]
MNKGEFVIMFFTIMLFIATFLCGLFSLIYAFMHIFIGKTCLGLFEFIIACISFSLLISLIFSD